MNTNVSVVTKLFNQQMTVLFAPYFMRNVYSCEDKQKRRFCVIL